MNMSNHMTLENRDTEPERFSGNRLLKSVLLLSDNQRSGAGPGHRRPLWILITFLYHVTLCLAECVPTTSSDWVWFVSSIWRGRLFCSHLWLFFVPGRTDVLPTQMSSKRLSKTKQNDYYLINFVHSIYMQFSPFWAFCSFWNCKHCMCHLLALTFWDLLCIWFRYCVCLVYGTPT